MPHILTLRFGKKKIRRRRMVRETVLYGKGEVNFFTCTESCDADISKRTRVEENSNW